MNVSIVSVLVVLVFSGSCFAICPDGWLYYQGSCYLFGHGSYEFQAAERYCEHFRASMVNIDTQTENSFLKGFAGDLNNNNYWIGLTDEVIEGEWKWYPSEITANFTDFAPRQPDGGKDNNCAVLWYASQYQWADEPCSHSWKPLCEIPSNRTAIPIVPIG